MTPLADNSIDLVVTSPPYPMIGMWDDLFANTDPAIGDHLQASRGDRAFEAMHQILDPVWQECFRVLCPGGFLCINIGDATRTLDTRFALYPNHARILSAVLAMGFHPLPCILWRKQTNAPNKFMGSGMLPAGAYVTLEHEYLLIFRKGDKREFRKASEKQHRQESAFFWEERNTWFSDVWMDLKGTGQTLADPADRTRSAAFPFALPYRLISMFSVKQDRVLDPFMGTGTTMAAAMACGRNSIGFETDPHLMMAIRRTAETVIPLAVTAIRTRFETHHTFVRERMASGKAFKHINIPYQFPVITNQEKHLLFHEPRTVSCDGDTGFEVAHERAEPLDREGYFFIW